MGRKTSSAAGLATSRGIRLLRDAAFGGAALFMALGLAVWVTDFDLSAWINPAPASANVGSTTSFDERFGPGSVRRSLSFNYPWRPAPRSNFDAEFGHIQSQLGGQSREEEEQGVHRAAAPLLLRGRSSSIGDAATVAAAEVRDGPARRRGRQIALVPF